MITIIKNKIKKIIYFTIYLLSIGLYLSCGSTDSVGTAPIEDNYIGSLSGSSLIVIYDKIKTFPSKNNITILLPTEGADSSSVEFTLEVSKGATLQDGNNNDLPLNANNQYTTNMDFNNGTTHDFTVTAQDGNASTTYTIGVLQKHDDSKEIISFAFLQENNSHLKANIAMDINTNNQTVNKTITNVEGITGLVPYIIHSGSNISPASGILQNFSTNNTYTITAINSTTSDYTVRLTSYYGVTINTNGGIIAGAPTTTEYVTYGNQAASPPDLLQKHYGLKGWYDAPSGGSVFDFNTKITTKTTIYAQWTNKQYTMSFDTDGGSAIAPITVDSLTPMTKPTDPTTNHYTLEGWYLNDSFTTKYDFNWTVSNNLTLYAKYINKQYRVRFYQGANLLSTALVTSLTTISTSDYPAYPALGKGYKWYSDNSLIQPYNLNNQVKGNFDLYAEEVTASFKAIIEDETIPTGLSSYGEISELIFSNYTAGATVVARYVKETVSGTGDGSSWDNAIDDIQGVLNEISDASMDRIYVVLVASGTYKPNDSYAMKNHIALVGGFTAGSYDRAGKTYLDGNDNKRVFYNNNNNLDKTALLYGVVVTNGNNATGNGSGMYNSASSPTLINVAFLDNTANSSGGGMYNSASSPTLINVTFLGNTANSRGGGMYNSASSPTLINVAFLDNTANGSGGGMYNYNSPSPTLINTTFSGNTADFFGGGMYNSASSPTLMNVTFSDNTVNQKDGGGMYNNASSPALMNVAFSGNKASFGGGIYNMGSAAPTLINVTFSDNTANDSGGGMANDQSSDITLINVTFSGNTANKRGGGIVHNGDAGRLILINTIFWENNNGNIYMANNSGNVETVNLYYSLVEGGVIPSTSASGIRLYSNDTVANPIDINSEEVIVDNPILGTLADNGGGVNTISIGGSSPAKDKGVYVRGMKIGNTYLEANLYYSINNTDWYSDPGLNTSDSPPNNAKDLTATDARGYGRVGRPDMGAYEVGGMP